MMFLNRFLPVIGLICLGLAACDSAADADKIGGTGCTPLDYTNGVFYFPCIGSDFSNGLSRFIADHPDLHVVSAMSNNTGSYGHTRGYFVVVAPN